MKKHLVKIAAAAAVVASLFVGKWVYDQHYELIGNSLISASELNSINTYGMQSIMMGYNIGYGEGKAACNKTL